MINSRVIVGLIVLILPLIAGAQDVEYANSVVKELSSDKYLGRGYVGKGDSIAADYLSEQMSKLKLGTVSDNCYMQHYTMPINRYPYEPKVSIGGRSFNCVADYNIYPSSPSIKGTFPIVWIQADDIKSPTRLSELLRSDLSNSFVALDTVGLGDSEMGKYIRTLMVNNAFRAKGVLDVDKSSIWRARKLMTDYVRLYFRPGVISPKDKTINIELIAEHIDNYKTQNVLGFIEGESDTTIIFSAHYDHLGMQGNHIYPGALDNASGVATVLSLAKEFAKKRQRYSMLFILVSGEECGLNGSKYFVQNPLVDLDKVKMVFNFDMSGAGERGTALFNGKLYPDVIKAFSDADDKFNCFENLSFSALTLNSDHASFYMAGVPALSFYTKGEGEKYYHKPTDRARFVTMEALEGIYRGLEIYIK